MALKTLTSNHRDLQQISIHVFVGGGERAVEIHRRWMDLDCFLAQLWEVNSFHTRVIYNTNGKEEEACECLERLFPKMTKRGIIQVDKL